MRQDPTAQLSVRRMLTLATSAFLVLAAEPLYLLVDTAVVGHLGAHALGALAVGTTLMAVLAIVGTFVEYGTTSRAARWFGDDQRDRAVDEGVQASYLAVVIGVVVVVVGQLLAGPLVRLLTGSSTELQAPAEQWFRIALCGMPMVLLVLAGNGWMRGVQLTRAPVVIVLVANGLSALASPLLVYPLGLGLVGSAWANLGAQVVAAGLFLRALHRETAGRRPDLGVMRAQLVLGRDLIVRAAAFQAAFMVAAGVAARMGTAQIAAHQIGMQLWEFTALLLDSFAIAAQSLVGAALGASHARVARQLAGQVSRWSFGAGTAFAAVYAAGWSVIPRLFTSSPAVLHQAHVLWPWFVVMLPAAGIVFGLDGVLIGAGDVAFLRTITIVAALGAFVPLTLAASHWDWGIGGVWAGLTAFIMVRLVGMVRRARTERWVVLGSG
ncbi:MATE family efflux transporter [Nocardioides sp.]|jgi:putative MATE family efflux protein|uniref:MATE family efflux transporter n=1 Tax=Nocardioides sp. TaxID=35761 RepID=UPI002F4002F5